jgi:polyadenylation factor subunit 2
MIKIWELSLNGEVRDRSVLNSNSDGVRGLGTNYMEQRFASCGEDKTVRVWDVNTLNCERTFEGHGNDVTTVQFHPSLALLASGAKDRLIKLWDPV